MPQEIVWLMGSPAAGKGTHSESIIKARGLTNPPIIISDLLKSGEFQEKINKGELICKIYNTQEDFSGCRSTRTFINKTFTMQSERWCIS